MTLEEYTEFVKFNLTGDVLELEISDESIAKVVKESLKEIQRYTNEFRLKEVAYSNCIDISGLDSYAVTNVYRTKSIANLNEDVNGVTDPVYLQFWTSFGLGTTYNLNNYILNFATYSELQQIRNTLGTDLFFKEDKHSKKLYVTSSIGRPENVVIEYIPIYKDVSEVLDEYWIDYLKRLALAKTKIILGRLRTSVKQSSALISLDGDTILEEGNKELDALREELEANNDLFYPVD